MKTDNYKKEVEEGYKIADELKSIMDSKESSSEINSYPHIKEWIVSDKDAVEVIEKLRSADDIATMSREYNNIDGTKHREILLKDISRARKSRLLKRVKIGVASIAASIAITLFVVYQPAENKEIIAENINHQKIAVPTLIHNGHEEELVENKKLIVDGKIIATSKNSKLDLQNNENNLGFSTLVVPIKQKYNLVLEDGTEVIINAGSSLTFPSKFSDSTRNVELVGEAFFKVTKSSKPFIVKVNNLSVNVYGTQFNIDGHSSIIKTTLVEGFVGVEYGIGNNRKEIKINPNECISVDIQKNRHCVVIDENIERFKYWLDGYFMINDGKLSNLMEDISKWHGVKFDYSKAQLRDKIVNAYIKCELPLEEVIEMIETSFNVKLIKKDDNEYIVK